MYVWFDDDCLETDRVTFGVSQIERTSNFESRRDEIVSDFCR